MEVIWIVLVSSVLGLCTCMNTWDLPYGNLLDYVTPELEQDWVSYKKSFNKTYDSAKEELTRRMYWEDNIRYFRDHNAKYAAGEVTFEVGENHMADMAEDEVKKVYLSGLKVPEEEPEGPWYPDESLEGPLEEEPLEKDWRRSGFVTPVKQQGRCGSCWTFSAVGALEGLHKKRTGSLKDLSEQNLLDCSIRGNHGCRGGWMNNAFDYVKSNGGIDGETCYPYVGYQRQCSYRPSCRATSSRGHQNVVRSESALTTALARVGPIAIATDANHRSFMYYRQGLYYDSSCHPQAPPTHAMTAVGYGSSRSGDYYIIKNSWGTGWGQSGYAFMARNKGNNCRIASYASFPV